MSKISTNIRLATVEIPGNRKTNEANISQEPKKHSVCTLLQAKYL